MMTRLLIFMLLTVLVGCVRGGGMRHKGGTVFENRSSHTVVFMENCEFGGWRERTLKPGQKMSTYGKCEHDSDIRLLGTVMDTINVDWAVRLKRAGRSGPSGILKTYDNYPVYKSQGGFYFEEGDYFEDWSVSFYDVDRPREDVKKSVVKDRVEMAKYFIRGAKPHDAIEQVNLAIELDPQYAKAYAIRSQANYLIGEYHKAWRDIYTAQTLGYEVPQEFLNNLRKASGRQR